MTKRTPLIVAVVFLVLPILYVSSYLALVTPYRSIEQLAIPPYTGEGLLRVVHYRIDDDWCEDFFWPLEQVDRRLRPVAWTERLFDGGEVSAANLRSFKKYAESPGP